ncbi:MAG: hypothetical protein JF597_46565 [Streptomyces sp.]|uniref:hypothetical protein n=1 Tax=Streptomyces sp. TaxID=1931 RepID=UPI0025ECAE5C|nr:hypothetical protein [Streptomyces sp.]MBW8800768.1 hypothetical protein [Streptomyces sp.]
MGSDDGRYDKVFADFTQQTGIRAEQGDSGSGEVVQRALQEKSNPQADRQVSRAFPGDPVCV